MAGWSDIWQEHCHTKGLWSAEFRALGHIRFNVMCCKVSLSASKPGLDLPPGWPLNNLTHRRDREWQWAVINRGCLRGSESTVNAMCMFVKGSFYPWAMPSFFSFFFLQWLVKYVIAQLLHFVDCSQIHSTRGKCMNCWKRANGLILLNTDLFFNHESGLIIGSLEG